MKPVVFVVEDSPHNLSHAMEFGEIRNIEQNDFPPYRDGSQVVGRIRRTLSVFNANVDYILLVGDPILVGLTFAVLREAAWATIRVLKWDRQSSRYVPITVPLS